MASLWERAAGACRRGREEMWAIVGGVPSILMHDSGASSQGPPHLMFTHKYVVGLFAFLISVDLVEIVGVLCYQLFTASYFPWHLYPLMLNRGAELLSLICAKGQVLTAFSIAQVCLTLISLTIFSKKQPCGRINCIGPLIMYGILLSYEIFVAMIMMKLSKMPMVDDDGQIVANWPNPATSTYGTNPSGIQLIGMPSRQNGTRVHNVEEHNLNSSRLTLQKIMDMDLKQMELDIILAVEQPDGQKIAIAKLCKEIKMIEDSTNTKSLKLDESTNTQSLPNFSSVLKDTCEEIEGNTSSYGMSQEVHEGSEILESIVEVESHNNTFEEEEKGLENNM